MIKKREVKKKKQKKIGSLLSQKISNRLSYTIIAFVGLMLIGVFVFAVAPDPGHDYRDLDLGPITIKDSTHYMSVEIDNGLEAEMFKAAAGYCIGEDCITSWSDIGGGGGDTYWATGSYGGIYYNDRVGIAGNTGPNGLELDVNGQIGADSYCDSQGYNCKTITELSSGGPQTLAIQLPNTQCPPETGRATYSSCIQHENYDEFTGGRIEIDGTYYYVYGGGLVGPRDRFCIDLGYTGSWEDHDCNVCTATDGGPPFAGWGSYAFPNWWGLVESGSFRCQKICCY